VTPTIPPRVDYELTKLGRTLLDPVRALAKWAARHREEIQAARDRFRCPGRRSRPRRVIAVLP